MKPSIEALQDQHAGQTVAVLGGGPSLPTDLAIIPPQVVLMAVKQHALRLVKPDYLVFTERPEKRQELKDALAFFSGTVVSPFAQWSDYLVDVPFWTGGFSSGFAAWLACYMGAGQVLLCGMDCYQGAQKYFCDRPGYYHPCFDYPVENSLAAWRPALDLCENAENIRAVSGPLADIFGRYEGNF
jgi:hypothetical protein